MKIIWLCNTLIEEVCEKVNIKRNKPESWISATYEFVKGLDDIEVMYLFPHAKHVEYLEDNFIFKSYPQTKIDKIESNQVEYFKEILKNYNPDVVHVFGTEYSHSLAMTIAAKELKISDRVVINIQGMVSIYSKHYFAFLPEKETRKYTFRDFVKRENLKNQQKKFTKRGKLEIEAIKNASHVIGRTDWDKACTSRINKDAKYHYLSETLRNAFYEDKWDYDKCEKHSIFASQCQYPIKGFHLLLEAFKEVCESYKDAKLYTTGTSPFNLSLKQKLRQTYYKKYLGKLIKKYNLKDKVVFLGQLSESEMKERLIKSNVFVCPSSIENSPNSLGEAMLLGVPSISSDVGGVKNLCTHIKEGYIYPADATYMLAYYIKKIFEDKNSVQSMCNNAMEKARKLYDKDNNFNTLRGIYVDIIKGN